MTKPSVLEPTERNAVRVLGVDPGSLTTGWGLLVGTASRPEIVDCGRIRLPSTESLPLRLARLASTLTVVVARMQPTVAAVETPFHGASARSSLQLAHARGVILAVLGKSRISVVEYTPATVKKTVSGDGRADKRRVGAMIVRTLGLRADRQSHDVHDALAVALCHLCTAPFHEAVRRAEPR
jgi:crossover junction endodeoxyribonuclease RuvC